MDAIRQDSIFPGFRLEIAIRSLRSPTECGRGENQDNYLVIDGHGQGRFLRDQQETQTQVPDWPVGHWRIAVLDGMGGHSHGREAAEQTVRGLLALPAATDLVQLSTNLEALHHKLYHQFQNAGLETGSTLIVLEIPPEGPALLFHVGDSRLYAIDAAQATCLTIDHVPATHLALLGLLDETPWFQWVHTRPNSQISQAFILGSTLSVSTLELQGIEAALFELNDENLPSFLRGLGDRRLLPLQPEQIYLLASDGLWHLADPQAFICRWPTLLTQPECSLETLLDNLLAALASDIRRQQSQPDDNCTVILLRKADPATASPEIDPASPKSIPT